MSEKHTFKANIKQYPKQKTKNETIKIKTREYI